MSVAQQWGRAIRAQRQLLGLTQAALAEKVGVTQGTVSRWERGDCQPEHRLIPLIASALCTVPSVLFPYPQAAAS